MIDSTLSLEEARRAAAAWTAHRRSRHPACFDEARATVPGLVASRPDLLVVPDSPYRISPCPRCRRHAMLGLPAREVRETDGGRS